MFIIIIVPIFCNAQTTGTFNGHEWVDLGLASGTLWASLNIGAEKLSDEGYKYAWGEVEYPSTSSYKYYKSVTEEENGFSVTYSGYTKYVPYNSSSAYKSYYDNKDVLDEEDDAAYVNWGPNWLMPTKEQCDELSNQCIQQSAEINGIKGVRFIGPNGNYIFLPNTKVGYWTRSRDDDRAQYATDFSNNYGFTIVKTFGAGERTDKKFIRPICLYKNQVEKCAKPKIYYDNKRLFFRSETENADFIYSITDTDIRAGQASEVQLTATYNISVYATKTGYDKSEITTATLCWIDQLPQIEGISNEVVNIPSRVLLIQIEKRQLTVQGADDGTPISVYTADGAYAGSAVSRNGIAKINANLQPESIAIVKVGVNIVKTVVK